MKIFFCHVPRNGGTFISRNIASNIGFDKTFSVDRTEITLQRFIEYRSNIVNDYDFITGHVPYQFIADINSHFDLIVVNIRSPIQRLISAFFRAHSESDLTGPSLIAEFKSFVQKNFFDQVGTRNEQCSYLGLNNRFASALEVVRNHPNVKVIRSEFLNSDLAKIFQGLSFKYDPDEQKNSSGGPRERLFLDISPGFYREIVQWFDDDYLLFEYFSVIDEAFSL